jgi:hypothetical protein
MDREKSPRAAPLLAGASAEDVKSMAALIRSNEFAMSLVPASIRKEIEAVYRAGIDVGYSGDAVERDDLRQADP